MRHQDLRKKSTGNIKIDAASIPKYGVSCDL